MASLKDIRSRIDSTKNTQQITRAMKMVAAAKLRKAQTAIQNSRPYAKSILNVISDIAATEKVEHPLLGRRENPKKILLVGLTSDRGLCGAFNTNANKAIDKFYKDNKDKYETIDFLFIGTKGADYMKRRYDDLTIVDTVVNLAREVSYDLAKKIADKLVAHFQEGEYDEVHMVYNEFQSAISQVVRGEQLLPVDLSNNVFEDQEEGFEFAKDFIFEPGPQEIVADLLKKHFAVQVYRCMLESLASEHGSRMSSMENATKNAGEMIRTLTLTYNKIRQAAITTELIEITSGAEALQG